MTSKIPELATLGADSFGLELTTGEGVEIGLGEREVHSSVQGITKLFALCALLRIELDARTQVGWPPAEMRYNSVSEVAPRARSGTRLSTQAH